MKTALNTSVILDVVTNDPLHGEASEQAIREAMARGQLVIGECVLAEISPAFAEDSLREFLGDWRILFCASSQESALEAGRMFRIFLERGAKPKRVLPDFLIGAHALHHADCLMARDRGYYRDYFKELSLVVPGQGGGEKLKR